MSITIEATQGLQQAATGERPVGPVIELAQTLMEEQQAELEQLRERLTYYQAFDGLINDNVKRSADLFRALYEERERARRQVVDARIEIEQMVRAEAQRRVDQERQRTQAMLMGLMDEAGRMQRQIDGWVQRISNAITEHAARSGDFAADPVPQIGG